MSVIDRRLLQQVPEGGCKKFVHDCGVGKSLSLTRDNGKVLYNCFRCGLSGRIQDVRHAPPEPPPVRAVPDFAGAQRDPSKWAVWAQAWRLQYSLTIDMVEHFHIRHCPVLDRILLPWYSGGSLVGFQARGAPGSLIKYTTHRLLPYVSLPTYQYMTIRRGVVLTEDITSAIRVGIAGYTGVALMGTSLPREALSHLLQSAYVGKALVWLDPDTAGRKATAKVSAKLRDWGLLHTDSLAHVVECEPKELHTNELRRQLQGFFRN